MATYKYRGYTLKSEGRHNGCSVFDPTGVDVTRKVTGYSYVWSLQVARDWIDSRPDALPRVIRTRAVDKIKTPRVVSDGGRRVHGFIRETNDCTVRAISHARCISYAEAHAICATVFHRAERHGPSMFDVRMGRVDWARRLKTTAKSLDAFALAHPVGHFLVLTGGHATAVCDGVVYDNGPISGLCHVQAAFEVIA